MSLTGERCECEDTACTVHLERHECHKKAVADVVPSEGTWIDNVRMCKGCAENAKLEGAVITFDSEGA